MNLRFWAPIDQRMVVLMVVVSLETRRKKISVVADGNCKEHTIKDYMVVESRERKRDTIFRKNSPTNSGFTR